MIPCDFHLMISLKCDSVIINLEGKSGTWLAIDLLGRRFLTDTIHYFDLEMDYRPLPQKMAKDCARMAKTFFLYILGAYLFANGGQTISFRWLALFLDFEDARGAYWGKVCLAWIHLTRGPCANW